MVPDGTFTLEMAREAIHRQVEELSRFRFDQASGFLAIRPDSLGLARELVGGYGAWGDGVIMEMDYPQVVLDECGAIIISAHSRFTGRVVRARLVDRRTIHVARWTASGTRFEHVIAREPTMFARSRKDLGWLLEWVEGGGGS